MISRGMQLSEAKLPKSERVYAVGDIHGCLSELCQILDHIKFDLKKNPVERHHLVFVGDYVDRGPDSKGVIDRLIRLQKSKPSRTHFIMGNHEQKLLQFLASPKSSFQGFFMIGGIETARSYGVKRLHLETASATKIRNKLMKKMPSEHMDFLRRLVPSYQRGDYFFCHAGIRPGISLREQSAHDLTWIRHEFLVSKKLHEKIIVHGHTPQPKPEVRENRINLDTKCYGSGVLTCLVLQGDAMRFIQTGKKLRLKAA